MWKERVEREKKSGGSLCRQVAKMLGGLAAFSSVFSQEPSATISSYPSPAASTLRSDRGRPPSYARAHSPAPLVLSPGIYNTLCFPSAICLGFSAPSLTLLSRVLFLFNSAVPSPFSFPPSAGPVIYPSWNLTSERVAESGRSPLQFEYPSGTRVLSVRDALSRCVKI